MRIQGDTPPAATGPPKLFQRLLVLGTVLVTGGCVLLLVMSPGTGSTGDTFAMLPMLRGDAVEVTSGTPAAGESDMRLDNTASLSQPQPQSAHRSSAEWRATRRTCPSTRAPVFEGPLARTPLLPEVVMNATYYGMAKMKPAAQLSKCEWARLCAWSAQGRLPVDVEGTPGGLVGLNHRCEEETCTVPLPWLDRGDMRCELPLMTLEMVQEQLRGVHVIVLGDSTGRRLAQHIFSYVSSEPGKLHLQEDDGGHRDVARSHSYGGATTFVDNLWMSHIGDLEKRGISAVKARMAEAAAAPQPPLWTVIIIHIASWDRHVFAEHGPGWANIMGRVAAPLQQSLGPRTTLMVREALPINMHNPPKASMAPDQLLPGIMRVNGRLRELFHADNTSQPILLPIVEWSAGPVQLRHRGPCALANPAGNHMELWSARRLMLFQVVYALQNVREQC